jgi:hypothetical protein
MCFGLGFLCIISELFFGFRCYAPFRVAYVICLMCVWTMINVSANMIHDNT